MKKNYRDKKDKSKFEKLLASGKLEGVIFTVLGGFVVFSIILTYVLYSFEILKVSDKIYMDDTKEPPSIKFLRNILDQRSNISSNNIFSNIFGPKKKVYKHIFGTDEAGRDIAHLLVIGIGTYILPGLVSIIITLFFGSISGILWGYYEGFIGSIVEFIIKVINSIPRLILLLIIGAVYRFNIYYIMIGLGFINFPKVAQLIKNKVVSLKKQKFIEAAKELGINDFIIIFKHIIWYNCKHILIIQSSFGMAEAILTETTLSYLNFGAQGISWGKMVKEGSAVLFDGKYWMSFIPASAIIITILGFYILGDGLTRLFELKSENN